MTGWPYTLRWQDFTVITPGPTQLRALNGQPIVARVSLSIMFYPASSPMTSEGGQYRFASVDLRVIRSSLEYAPSRIPHGQEAHYLRHEQGHMDLMGLFAREMECNLLALRAPGSPALLTAANTTVDQGVENARMWAINTPRIDCLYDRETNHGMLRARQDH
jgi:hypothetical protein